MLTRAVFWRSGPFLKAGR